MGIHGYWTTFTYGVKKEGKGWKGTALRKQGCKSM